MQRSESLVVLPSNESTYAEPQTPTTDAPDGAMELDDEPLPPRPRTRSDCERGKGIRPCPYVGCRHHLRLDVTEGGALKVGDITLPPNASPEHVEAFIELASDAAITFGDGCSLDIAERDEGTLEEIGLALNVTRERIRQIEAKAKRNLLRRTPRAQREGMREALEEVLRTKRDGDRSATR